MSVPDGKSTPPTATETKEARAPLPPLSPADFRVFNHMAEHMDLFHNHFRQSWNMLYSSCEANKRTGGMSIRAFLFAGEQFCQGLEVHHGIEERHIFPMLAKRMPEFRNKEELIAQHKEIHKGLDEMTEYLGKCASGEVELRLVELKRIMDGFGKVLWQHLDQEVKTLGAENMRRYWTKDEVARMRL